MDSFPFSFKMVHRKAFCFYQSHCWAQSRSWFSVFGLSLRSRVEEGPLGAWSGGVSDCVLFRGLQNRDFSVVVCFICFFPCCLYVVCF